MIMNHAVMSRDDTDLYKITMAVAQCEKQFNNWTRYVFANRTKGVEWSEYQLDMINAELDYVCNLQWTDEEINYLYSIPYLSKHKGTIEMLRNTKLDRRYIKTWLDENKQLHIEAEGPVWIVSQFEIYVLEIVSFVWNLSNANREDIYNEGVKRWCDKMAKFEAGQKYEPLKGKIAEFGSRRRNLPDLQEFIVKTGAEAGIFNGTSNVRLARLYHLTPIGTYAHEYVMAYQAKKGVQLAYSNKAAMDDWLDVYQGDLGIALTDTITTKVFMRDFDTLHMRQFAGVRTDSGDDHEHIDNFEAAYKAHGVDPKTKVFLVSNSYDFDKALEMMEYVNGRMIFRAGIGTYITNDSVVPPLNIVMKVMEINGKPVAKISDDMGKTMCESPAYVSTLKQAITWRLDHEED